MNRGTRSLSLGIAILALAACGGDDDSSDARPPVGDTRPAATAGDSGNDGGDDPGATFGQVLDGTIELSGAVDETYEPDDTTRLVAAGGCQGSQFGVQLQVNDTSIPQTIVNAAASVDADLSGGTTGTFEIADLQVEVFERGDLSQRRSFRGPATVEVTEHKASAELHDRRMTLSIAAEGLTTSGDPPLDFGVEIVWVMGCP
jgi:hypothetical protein